MVLLVLHKHYVAFANVRVAIIPADEGEPGELRLACVGHIQHRLYQPKPDSEPYRNINIQNIDGDQLDVVGCDTRVVTYDDYEYWFRFPTDADATIFYRVLCYKLDQIECGESELRLDEEDYWEEGPWTVNEVNWQDLCCRCDCHGHIRYRRDYNT